MDYQVTVRYGGKSQRYLTLTVGAPDVPAALRRAAQELPEGIVPTVDLVELRLAPDFDKRFPETDPP